MAYEKSVINIDINFDNEGQAFLKPPKPVLLRKVPKDRITVFQPSAESKKTSLDIQKRVQELHKFRRESQSALKAPLLVTALVKKTNERLNTILVSKYVVYQYWGFGGNRGNGLIKRIFMCLTIIFKNSNALLVVFIGML